MMRVRNTALLVDDSDLRTERAAVWEEAPKLKYGSLALYYFVLRREKFLEWWLRYPRALGILKQAPSKVRCVLNQPDPFHFIFMRDLAVILLITFLGNVIVKEKSVRRLWKLRFDATLEPIENPKRDVEIARYR